MTMTDDHDKKIAVTTGTGTGTAATAATAAPRRVAAGMTTIRRFAAAIGLGIAVAIAVAVILIRSRPAAGERGGTAAPAVSVAIAATPPSSRDKGRTSIDLPQQARLNSPIRVVAVAKASMAGDIQAIGNVSYDADHFAIVGPLVPGRITRLNSGVGDTVRRGQVMAEIESADVGEARGALISAKARLAAAEANMRRERELADKRISSAREREMAEAQWASEDATMRAAEERLRAIGLTARDIESVEKGGGGRVAIRSPIGGTVIERLVTAGEAVERASDAFKVAELSRVWVLLDLYEKDLARVRVGQSVEVRTEAYPGLVFTGRVAYVAPVIDQSTRTAKVRVEIDNRARKLNIGQLVTARLIGNADVATEPVLTVPTSALQRVDGKPLVFVKAAGDDGFHPRNVEVGLVSGDLVEVRSGLREGEMVASDGAFLLKSELLR